MSNPLNTRSRKQKLELTWIGKYDKQRPIEPRILIEVPELSYHADKRYSEDDIYDNRLICGDNLLALKALEQEFLGKIKCIYIDPPYNTGAAFEHYDDNLQHSQWLCLMRERLELLRNLLSDDGAICVQIDATEMAYLKVLMDEIFIRNNFVNIISVKTKIAGVSGSNVGKSLQDNVEFILVYAKDVSKFILGMVPTKNQELIEYINSYDEQGKSWKYTSVFKEIGEGRYIKSFFAGNGDEIKLFKHDSYEITSINQIARDEFAGDLKKAYYTYVKRVFRTTNAQTSIRTKVLEETKIFGNKGVFSIEYTPIKGRSAGKVIRSYYKDNNLVAWLSDVVKVTNNTIVKVDNLGNLWDDIQYNNLTKEGQVQFPNGKKPEALIARIINMLSSPGEIILDSFLGSGTTAAVAHKMGRRWIGIELGEHCYTHCVPRLHRVVDGTDQGGITKDYEWQGGGGFRFYKLAPSLIVETPWGGPTINPSYNGEMLAEALCKLDGYTYNPSPEIFWQQGLGTENSYLYATTQTMTASMLEYLSEEVGEGKFLTVYCGAYEGNVERFSNLLVKKIPKEVLERCEWNHDDYSLQIENLPQAESLLPDSAPKKKRNLKGNKLNPEQRTFFDFNSNEEGAEE